MEIPIFLAHGALGPYDDLIMLGVATIFLIMMGVSWIKSSTMEPLLEDDEKPNVDEQDSPESTSDQDRFPLD